MSKLFRSLICGIVIAGVACAQPLLAQEVKPHGDHSPHHGGLVLMYGMDLHYEIVLTPAGNVELWLSDGARDDLPAAVVSDVTAEIERVGGKREPIDMAIAPTGESWIGKGSAIGEQGTVLHLAFVFREEAAVVQFPASALMGPGRERLVHDSARGGAHGK